MRIALVGAELEENLAVRYVRAALEAAGHTVSQITFNSREGIEPAASELASSGAELAGFSMVFTYRAREFADLAARAREMGYAGHITAGGHFAAFNAEALLRDCAAFDSVVIGEGEEIACRLAAGLDDPDSVPGLVWRGADGGVVRNPGADKPADLDSLPEPPHREPFDDYLGLPIVNMLGSRGCTHSCGFCSIAAWHRMCGGRRFRVRRPEAIAEEMAGLYRRGVRVFNFHDDNFLLGSRAKSLERYGRLADALRSRGVGRIAFAVKSRPDSVSEDLFSFLKSIGLFRVFLGVEAGTAESLDRLGRCQSTAQNLRALEIVNRLDLHACFNLLMLNPDSTLEDFAANVDFLRSSPRNPMNFCRTEVYAGTPLEEKLRGEGRLLGDYWGYDYRISDPGAQEVFEVVYPAFRARNFGEEGIHHLAMAVDYEHQVLSHFLGSDAALRRAVKDFIVAVNLNTCNHLEEGIAAVRRGFGSDAERRDFREDLTLRVEIDNRRLHALGQELRVRIAALAAHRRAHSRGRPVLRAGAAGVLIAGTLLSSGCGCRRTYPHEQAPKPPPKTHPCEVAAAPPLGSGKLIRAQVVRDVLPLAAKDIEKPAAIVITISLDGTGI